MTFDFTHLTAQSRYLVDKTFYVELSEDALLFWHHRHKNLLLSCFASLQGMF